MVGTGFSYLVSQFWASLSFWSMKGVLEKGHWCCIEDDKNELDTTPLFIFLFSIFLCNKAYKRVLLSDSLFLLNWNHSFSNLFSQVSPVVPLGLWRQHWDRLRRLIVGLDFLSFDLIFWFWVFIFIILLCIFEGDCVCHIVIRGVNQLFYTITGSNLFVIIIFS